MEERAYIAIDLKSFYASVECVEAGMDPLNTNLVVADASRTDKTICLAVSPPLKARGVPGRPRLFEAKQAVARINAERVCRAPSRAFAGSSVRDDVLRVRPDLAVDYIVAKPRMAVYMRYSSRIYGIYLRYVAPEDIHVYSVDEVFMDVTPYLRTYGVTPRQMAELLLRAVVEETGITGTAGIGTNLYLCKVAMDILAKHAPPDEHGARIAELDEVGYRRLLWTHLPLTDFWRVGPGYAARLRANGLYTMGDIARCSLGGEGDFHNQDLLYRLFGVNAELLIDHAWGKESCTMADIKAYRPEVTSVSSGQVLSRPYSFAEARVIAREMAESLAMDLVGKRMMTDQVALSIGYEAMRSQAPSPDTELDLYGRTCPKPAHGSADLGGHTSSTARIVGAVMELYDRLADPALYVRRVGVGANNTLGEEAVRARLARQAIQLDLFTGAGERASVAEEAELLRERRRQEAVLTIRARFGKNAVLKGTDFVAGATLRERNQQIGGHKA